MTSLLSIPHRLDRRSAVCRAIIETPKGSRTKYDYDPESSMFLLDKVLPAGMSFPLDFGFIPSTKAEDGDPLDILVLHDEPIPAGILLETRLIGAIIGEQSEEDGRTIRNDRLIGVSMASSLYRHISEAEQLGAAYLEQLVCFWVNYNELRGRNFTSKGVKGPPEAVALVEKASLF